MMESQIILKYASNSFIKPLTLIVNQVLHTGIFPRQLKLSRVQPYTKVVSNPISVIIDPSLCYHKCLKCLNMSYLIS